MSVCECHRCAEHWLILGLSKKPSSHIEITQAYKDSVKIWHPDRFESDQRLRSKAEEQFKRVQVAYRELGEHTAPIHSQSDSEEGEDGPHEGYIEAGVFKVISLTKRIPLSLIHMESSFESLGIDSLDRLNILFDLESEFSLEIPNEHAKEVSSMRELVEGLRSLIAAKATNSKR